MTSAAAPGNGYELAPQELAARVTALAKLSDQASGLVASASRLAEWLPQLGTAPPAMHLAMRLRAAAGRSGLTGEVGAASAELSGFHRTLQEVVTSYLECEDDVARTFQAARENGPVT